MSMLEKDFWALQYKHETADDARSQIVSRGKLGSLAGKCSTAYLEALIRDIDAWREEVFKRLAQTNHNE